MTPRPIANVRVGTCGWTEPTLVKARTFYPPGASNAEKRLRYYASRFPLVEVDSTFYSPPTIENAQRWADRTPPGFVFDVKAHAMLTGHAGLVKALPEDLRDLVRPDERGKARIYARSLTDEGRERLWALHVEALRPLDDAGKLGAVLFQFPPWFTNNRENREYLALVGARLPWTIAVEFRGGGWMDEDRRARTLKHLEKLGLAYVMVDGPRGFPSSTPPVVAQTAELAMVRFLGRNARTWATRTRTAAERFQYLYSPEELAPWARAVAAIAPRAGSVHALMNNCHGDDAVRNADDFRALVTRELGNEQPELPLAW